MGISVRQIFDQSLICSVLSLPEVAKFAEHSDVNKSPPQIDARNGWYACCKDGKLTALIHLYQIMQNTVEIHPHFLSVKESRNSILAFYKYFLTLPSDINKIISLTPEKFKTTINLAKKMGMIAEGYIKESYNSDNQLIGTVVMSISRDQVKAVLNG